MKNKLNTTAIIDCNDEPGLIVLKIDVNIILR